MPHSARVYGNDILALDSGRGQVIRIDPGNGARTDVAFCPGFLRGMALHNGHALVTVSKPRSGTFAGLSLDGEMRARDAEPWCGVLVVDLSSGGIIEWIKLEGFITELFDIAVLPGVRCPMSIGPETLEIRSTITFEDAVRPLE